MTRQHTFILSLILLVGCMSADKRREEQFNRAKELLMAGEALFQDEKWEESIEVFDDAIDAHPDGEYGRAFYMRGNANRKLKKKEEAIADYTRAMTADPTMDRALFNRAGLYLELQQWRFALRDLQRYRKANPDDTRTLKLIGGVMYEHIPAKRKEALAFLTRYLEVVGKDEQAERWVEELKRDLEVAPSKD